MADPRRWLELMLLAVLTGGIGCTLAGPPELVEPGFTAPVEAEGWWVVQRAEVDFDGDGEPETAVLRAQVEVYRGQPLWEDGHHWHLYVREEDGATTDLYARFVPFGRVDAMLVSPADRSGPPAILLMERTPQQVVLYEIRYHGPGRAEAVELVRRPLDPVRGFAEPLPYD